MKKKFLLLVLSLVCVLAVSMLGGCACSKESSIAGLYVKENGTKTIEFKSNGEGKDVDGFDNTWYFDKNNDNLVVTYNGLNGTDYYLYDSKNETLTRAEKDGSTDGKIVYKKTK